MGIPESEERKTALASVIGKVEYEPRRRDDLDFVFVAAHAEQGRLIIPQLRFNRLGSLPVFATAQVFDNGTGDADLSGLRSCDMPMMLGAGGRYAALRGQLNDVLPGRTREQQRLFALGYDAYQLIGFLRAGPLPSGGGFPAATGDLGMGSNGAVTRTLTCGTLQRATL
jgi:outer membrane PBP1 activator LpoA protein